MDFTRQTRELLKEVRYTGDTYIDAYSFKDPGQMMGEKKWEDLAQVFEKRSDEHELTNMVRGLFLDQIKTLLMPCLRNKPDAIPQHERMKLLQMRRCMLMDVHDSVQSLLDIHTLLGQSAGGQRFKMGIMGNMIHDDVEHLLPIEKQTHGEHAWGIADFHKLVKKRSSGIKSARKKGLGTQGLPHVRVATTHDGHRLGYMAGEFETADVRYKTIHGLITGSRYRMVLQTAGVRRDASPAVVDEMTYDLLESVIRERPHRLENRLGSYHS